MDKVNENFVYNDCGVQIRYTPADQYGVDRHMVIVSKPMCKDLRDYTFRKTKQEIVQYAKELTAFQCCTCG